ncbi:MAG: helix-turn-helix domain-containing protein [Pirellulales bacterium]
MKEAAEYTCLGKRTLQSLTASRDIRHAKVGKSVVYSAKYLDEYMEGRMIGGDNANQ